MFKKISSFFVTLVQKYLPDPFLFAILLTFIVFIMGIVITGQTPLAMVVHWGNGFWNLLSFSMQMVLILVTGHTLANAPVIKRGLTSLANSTKKPSQAIILVSFVSAIASWINWGFGLVVGALLAREIAKTVKKVDYRLLIASAYSGFVVWHGGLSGSIPLKIASAGHLAEKITGGPVPTSLTIFAPFNLIISAVIIVLLPFINRAMMPDEKDVVEIDPCLLEESEAETAVHKEKVYFADKVENSFIISLLTGIMGLAFVFYYFAKFGFKLNLNIVNFTFLFVGILLHGTPKRFLTAVANAVKGSAGIIIQFPFYAGIMGMMVGPNPEGLSLAQVMSNWFVAISNQTTFPLFTFLSAGLVNFFVPSGGGQWAVQGPIMMPAGAALGVNAAKTAMAIAWGDAWTNMVQPFWALPALGIAGLGARDIMGYCIVVLLVTGVIAGLGLMFL